MLLLGESFDAVILGDTGGGDAPYLAVYFGGIALAWWISAKAADRRRRREVAERIGGDDRERFLLRYRLSQGHTEPTAPGQPIGPDSHLGPDGPQEVSPS